MNLTLTLKAFWKSAPSCESLMVRFAQSGDNDLLSQLYDICGDDLYHFILTQSDATLAKDICQKTWLKVIEKKHLYQRTGSFKGWLYTIARNQLIDEMRRPQPVDCQHEDIGTPSTDHLPSGIEARFELVLLRLPFEQREAFCLQQEGFGIKEISQITHCGIETVKSRLRYAKSTLRAALENYHE